MALWGRLVIWRFVTVKGVVWGVDWPSIELFCGKDSLIGPCGVSESTDSKQKC